MKSVLAAIDFSAGDRRVIAEAVALARALDARLVVLHVVQPPPVSDADVGGLMSGQYTALAAESTAAALAVLQKMLQTGGVTIQTSHVVGIPGHLGSCLHLTAIFCSR